MQKYSCNFQKKIIILIATLLFSFESSLAAAHSENDKHVHIATSASIPPYFIKEQDKGIVADIIKESFKTQGYKVSFSYFSNNEIQKSLLTKHVVGAFNFPTRKISNLYYTKPIIHYENIVVTLTKTGHNIESLSDLTNLNVGSFENSLNFLGDDFKNKVNDFTSYTEYKIQEEQVKDLLNKKVDAIIIDKNIFDFYYHKISGNQSNKNHEITKSFLFPRSARPLAFLNKKLRNEFDKGFIKLQESGDYYKILHKYVD